MTTPGYLVLAILALGVLGVLFPLLLHTISRYREARRLRCPITGEQVRVDFDAPHAGWTALFGAPHLRVRWCSLWTGAGRCAEGCTHSPEAKQP
jgi:hypothetical protein